METPNSQQSIKQNETTSKRVDLNMTIVNRLKILNAEIEKRGGKAMTMSDFLIKVLEKIPRSVIDEIIEQQIPLQNKILAAIQGADESLSLEILKLIGKRKRSYESKTSVEQQL